MARKIKFRAWLSGKHGSLEFLESEMQYNAPVIECKWADIESGWDIHGLYDTVPLMQNTGLKDRNGKEIYEGDIIGTITGKYILDAYLTPAIVVYENGCFLLKSINFNKKSFLFSGLGIANPETNMTSGHNPLIIKGNIFENPELLKSVGKNI